MSAVSMAQLHCMIRHGEGEVYGQPGDCENEDSLNGWVKVLSIYGVISGYQRGV